MEAEESKSCPQPIQRGRSKHKKKAGNLQNQYLVDYFLDLKKRSDAPHFAFACNKVVNTLMKYPLPLLSSKQALLLEGFGPKFADIVGEQIYLRSKENVDSGDLSQSNSMSGISRNSSILQDVSESILTGSKRSRSTSDMRSLTQVPDDSKRLKRPKDRTPIKTPENRRFQLSSSQTLTHSWGKKEEEEEETSRSPSPLDEPTSDIHHDILRRKSVEFTFSKSPTGPSMKKKKKLPTPSFKSTTTLFPDQSQRSQKSTPHEITQSDKANPAIELNFDSQSSSQFTNEMSLRCNSTGYHTANRSLATSKRTSLGINSQKLGSKKRPDFGEPTEDFYQNVEEEGEEDVLESGMVSYMDDSQLNSASFDINGGVIDQNQMSALSVFSERSNSDLMSRRMSILANVDFIGDRFERELVLIVDTREIRNQGDRKYLFDNICKSGVNAEQRNLGVGDFLWILKLKCYDAQTDELKIDKEYVLEFIIERKAADDLAASIFDGRYEEQKSRLLASKLKNVFYLVEGKPSAGCRVHESRLQSALVKTMISSGFKTIETVDVRSTVKFIVNMHKKIQRHVDTLLNDDVVQNCSEYKPFNQSMLRSSHISVKKMCAQLLKCVRGCGNEQIRFITKNFQTPIQLREYLASEESKQLLQRGKSVPSKDRKIPNAVHSKLNILFNQKQY